MSNGPKMARTATEIGEARWLGRYVLRLAFAAEQGTASHRDRELLAKLTEFAARIDAETLLDKSASGNHLTRERLYRNWVTDEIASLLKGTSRKLNRVKGAVWVPKEIAGLLEKTSWNLDQLKQALVKEVEELLRSHANRFGPRAGRWRLSAAERERVSCQLDFTKPRASARAIAAAVLPKPLGARSRSSDRTEAAAEALLRKSGAAYGGYARVFPFMVRDRDLGQQVKRAADTWPGGERLIAYATEILSPYITPRLIGLLDKDPRRNREAARKHQHKKKARQALP